MSLLASIDKIYTQDEPGPFCNNHRSFFCPCVAQFLEDRGDVNALSEILNSEQAVTVRTDLYVLVPVFPEFCVWEKLAYQTVFDERIGAYGLLPDQLVKRHNLHGIRRLTAGESVWDLAHVIIQQLDDDLDLIWPQLSSGLPGRLSWRCESSRHSLKYQRVVDQVTEPRNVRRAWDGQMDKEVLKAMVYCLMRHKRCLFCYVNENNRDAVRVNPDMQAVLGHQGGIGSNDTDFEDLIPS